MKQTIIRMISLQLQIIISAPLILASAFNFAQPISSPDRKNGRIHHRYSPRPNARCTTTTERTQKRTSFVEIHLHANKGDNDLSPQILDMISYRPVEPDDITKCHEIEAASYPEDEAASLENLMYRQQSAGDYFWCATLPADEEAGNAIIGFICSTRCNEFTEESMSTHDPRGSILAIHSVVVDSSYRRQGVASAMMKHYLRKIVSHSNLVANTGDSGFTRMLLLAKSHLLSFYIDNGFMVLRPSPIVHGKETWYELQARQEHLERMIRMQGCIVEDEGQPQSSTVSISRKFESSRSTSNPDEGNDGNALAKGRDLRRAKLHAELAKLGIDPIEMESHPDRFGTAAIRTYNSFLLPKSAGALAVAGSPTRHRVVANNISFLVREFNADQEQWLRNVDRNRGSARDANERSDDAVASEKHPITIVLDNIRSAHNVGNILRLAEAAQVDSVRLCGMTPRPPHPKVLKTAMGAAEHVSLGDANDASLTTLQTVLDLKSKGYKVFASETTANATSLWDTPILEGDDDDDATESSSPVAFVFGNELIGVDVQVLRECDGIICLPTYGMKNSLNVATCVGIIVWDALRRLKR